MASRQHLIKNKHGDVVAIAQRPQDVEEEASGRPPSPPPSPPPPDEIVFGFLPPVSTTGQLIGWPYYLPPHQANSNWCIPDGAFVFYISVQKSNQYGVYTNPIGFPIQDMTVTGRIYSASAGSITEAFNKGTFKLEWQTLSSHYGPNHVRPTAVFSNLQTGTFVNYAGSPVSPGVPPTFSTAGQQFVGDAIDFTITHTGMHDVGWPHQTGGTASQTWSNYMDPTGNQHFLVSGLYSEFNRPATCYAVELYSIAYDGQVYDPYNLPLPWMQSALANPDKEIFPIPIPPAVPGLRHILAGFDVFGVGVSAIGACTGIFQSWPYAYKQDWTHDTIDPDKALVSGNNTLTHPWPSGVLDTSTYPCGFQAPFILAGTQLTVQELNAYADCGWQPHMQNTSAHLDYPNQVSFCEWRADWVNNGSIVGGFASPTKPASAPGIPFLGQMAHEVWGYTAAQMEDDDFCSCCDNLVDPGVAAYPYPPMNGAVKANWVHP